MNKIKQKRLEKGIMQRGVSKILNVSTKTYQRIENGQKIPSQEQLEKISNLFNCEKEELL